MLKYDVTCKLLMYYKKSEPKGVFIFSILMLILSIGFVENLFIVSAITGSMGNARMVVYPNANQEIQRTILVQNKNDEIINITIRADDNAAKFITVVDSDFMLDPNTEKKAVILIKASKDGRYEGKVNVFFTPLTKNEAGVALSSNIIAIVGDVSDSSDDLDSSDDTSENAISRLANSLKNKFPVMIILSMSTFVLFIMLILLLFMIKKRKNRGVKLNGNRKKK